MKKEVKWDRTALIVEVCCIVLVGLLDLSLCWMDGMLAYHKVLVVLVNVVGIIIFPWLFCCILHGHAMPWKKPWQIWNKAGRRSGRIIKRLSNMQPIMLVCGLGWELLSGSQRMGQFSHGGNTIFFAGCASLILTFWLMRRQMAEKTEGAFAVTALILGLTFYPVVAKDCGCVLG